MGTINTEIRHTINGMRSSLCEDVFVINKPLPDLLFHEIWNAIDDDLINIKEIYISFWAQYNHD